MDNDANGGNGNNPEPGGGRGRGNGRYFRGKVQARNGGWFNVRKSKKGTEGGAEGGGRGRGRGRGKHGNGNSEGLWSKQYSTKANSTTNSNDGAGSSRDGTELKKKQRKRVKLDDDKEENVKDIDIESLIKGSQSLSISSITPQHMGKCITIKGNVVRIETTKEVCTTLAFKCIKCGEEFTVHQKDGTFTQPTSCESIECFGKMFEPLENSDLTQLVDQRRIRLQEVRYSNDIKKDSPGNIDCILTKSWTECCSAGDSLTVIGVLKLNESSELYKRAASNQHGCYLEALDVKNDKNYEKSSEGELFNFSQKDLEAFKEIEKYKGELFRFLVHSIAPCIYGYELIKAGLLLSLFGGNSLKSEKTFRRNDIHMLIVGDPGMGKSQLLKTVKEVAPRGVYLSGGTSTITGLTVTMVKDGDGYTIEAGALMMADEGVCCIDEFDKMQNQHSALLEAMEQQSISIAKAGVFRTLPARATVIAAANPVRGHYDSTRTVSENIKLHPALLSRFDLIFVLRDNPNKNMDLRMSEYLLEAEGIKSIRGDAFSNVSEDKLPLIERLKYKKDGDVREIDPLPSILMRKYISYARQKIHPKTSPEAGEILKNYYLKLRSKHKLEDSTPVTIRQFESLVRLAEARAKLELRETVTSKDAQDIIEIFEYGMMGVYDDDSDVRASQIIENSQFQRAISDASFRVSSKSHARKLLSALQSAADRQCKSLFSFNEIKEIGFSIGLAQVSTVQQVLDKLNIEGALIKSGPKVFKLTSASY